MNELANEANKKEPIVPVYEKYAQYYSSCLQTYILFQYGKVRHES